MIDRPSASAIISLAVAHHVEAWAQLPFDLVRDFGKTAPKRSGELASTDATDACAFLRTDLRIPYWW